VEAVAGDPFTGVRIQGSGGADTLSFVTVTLTNIEAIDGGGGADTITGSTAPDVIHGGGGTITLPGVQPATVSAADLTP
jgi:hypothetical protein